MISNLFSASVLLDVMEVLTFLAWGTFLVALLVICALAIHLMVIWGIFIIYRDRGLEREEAVQRLPLPDDLPHVLIQLPTFNEPEVVERSLEAAAAIDWPRDRLHIQLLDDSTDETTGIAQAKIDELRARGIDAVLLHRENREGFKAGALKAGLEASTAEYVAVFDADFVPPPDVLKRTLRPLINEKNLAFVQTRWEHANVEKGLLTRAQGLMLDSHFGVEQCARSWAGLPMSFNGTGGV
nr:glycosyltransferase [Micropepsaceae bacterium]